MFQVNGKPIYICGNNWVPAHNQTPAISRETYNSLFDLALRNNNNMIRLWGGGKLGEYPTFEHTKLSDSYDRLLRR